MQLANEVSFGIYFWKIGEIRFFDGIFLSFFSESSEQ